MTLTSFSALNSWRNLQTLDEELCSALFPARLLYLTAVCMGLRGSLHFLFCPVAVVGGQPKTRLSFDCGSDSSSTSSDPGARMASRQGSSSCRSKTRLKRQSLSRRNHSVFYPVDEESVHQRPAEEPLFPAPFTNTTPNAIYPPAKVNPYLYWCVLLSLSLLLTKTPSPYIFRKNILIIWMQGCIFFLMICSLSHYLHSKSQRPMVPRTWSL